MDFIQELKTDRIGIIRADIVKMVQHYIKVWELDYKQTWNLLYKRLEDETGFRTEKSKLPRIEQVIAAGKIEELHEIAKKNVTSQIPFLVE